MKTVSLIFDKKDLENEKTRKKLADKILTQVNELAVAAEVAVEEAFQIDIYPVSGKLYYRTDEIAKVFQVTDRMVRKWCKQGKIYALQTPGGSWRIPASQFKDLPKVQTFQDTAVTINKRFKNSPDIDEFER